MKRFPLVATILLLVLIACSEQQGPKAKSDYVGRDKCISCHPQDMNAWTGSHHDLAIDTVADTTVLGNFNDAEFNHLGVASRFFKNDSGFFVYTEGAGGNMDTFRISYVFGITPLQQYLVEFPGGRLQTLPLCWDSRTPEEGGQRWFHIYDQERIDHLDLLYWTGQYQNWNFMCADCHSTNLKRNYDLQSNSFRTTWSEIDVSCEACHGAGSNHMLWSELQENDNGDTLLFTDYGLDVVLDTPDSIVWMMDVESGTAKRSVPRTDFNEINVCAPCHSRRAPMTKNYTHGDPYHDHFRLTLLNEPTYYPDGQIRDEDYVYASFLQSKMYAAGVTCTDCHDPHTMVIKFSDNNLCNQCHFQPKYDTAEHHFHKPDSTGASCFGCHMPESTYMVVDPRRDHSFVIPRPDLSDKFGSPDPCFKCHENEAPGWNQKYFEEWYDEKVAKVDTYGEVMHSAHLHEPGSREKLRELIGNREVPAIRRASALIELGFFNLNESTLDILEFSLGDKNPLVRFAAVSALEYASPQTKIKYLPKLLKDSNIRVRTEAARIMAPYGKDLEKTALSADLNYALKSYVEAQGAAAETPAAHMNLGNLYITIGDPGKAQMEYEMAIELDSLFAPGYANLADLYRAKGDEIMARKTLERGLNIFPDNAALNFALALTLVRQKQLESSLVYLEKSTSGDTSPRYYYVYYIALNTVGKPDKAALILNKGLKRYPNDESLLIQAVQLYQKKNQVGKAKTYARRLTELVPENQDYQNLLSGLDGSR